MKYKEVNLGELVSFVSKGIPPKYIETKSDNTIVVLNQRTNRNFQIDYSLSRLNDLSKKKVPTNKILIDYDVLINSTGVGTAGRVAQLVKVPELTTVDGHMIIVRPDEEKIDPLYLGYALKAQQVKIEGLQEGSTGQTELNRQRLLNDIIIQFPESRKLQQDISRLFFSLDEKIENNKKINHHLEEMATSIFENMFPNVSSGKSTIGNYIIPKHGKNLLSKDAIVGKVPVVAGGLQPSTFHNIANTKSPVLTISASGANAGYVNLWHIPVWSSDSSYIDTSITDNVYFWYVMLKKRQQEIYDSQTGSAQPHIYPKHIEIMPTIDLSEDKVSRFTKQVTPLFESIGNNIKEIGELQTLRDTLLPKLLSGKISVNQASK
ncbi:restriction endonuclease subunit S [Streptococcus mutans]|nr:restriction endonuclease subunit S [Streptococcus mutans]MCB5012881.1 restriction endonuclease subunit S [Streptococcus mutans]MCB5084580.1 restriction endonuclease subunit S [Streptococcus mutans]